MPPASFAPLFVAAITPGPPPVMTAKPARASAAPRRSPSAQSGWSSGVRAEPNTLTAGPSSASAPKPSTNSDWMRSTRQGSECTQSVGPRLSSSRWSVVVPGTSLPRSVTGPCWYSSRSPCGIPVWGSVGGKSATSGAAGGVGGGGALGVPGGLPGVGDRGLSWWEGGHDR